MAYPKKLAGRFIFIDARYYTYVMFNGWTHPWRAIRSIGYPAFIYPFLYSERDNFHKIIMSERSNGADIWKGPEEPIYAMVSESGMVERFEAIAFAQRVILSFAAAVFYLSLCRWFTPIFSFFALCVALWLAPLPNPQFIMTEPLSCALTWLCAAFLLYAPISTKKSMYYVLACFCAAFAFLVRPQNLSLTGLCSLIFLYEVIFSGRHHFFVTLLKRAVIFSPLLLAYGYIAWICLTGGGIYLHTLAEVYYTAFCAYAETEDVPYMPIERSRKFTSWFGEHKEKLISKIKANGVRFPEKASPPRIRQIMGDGLLYCGGMSEAWVHFSKEKGLAHLSRQQHAVFGKELNAGLKKRHAREILTNHWENFLGGLGYYKDIYRLAHLSNVTFLINMVALSLSLAGIILVTRIRWPVSIMAAIHLMALFAAALGHFVIGRYVEPTEPLLLLAGLGSSWALCGCLIGQLKKHAVESSPSDPTSVF
ncbi:MAG: hypothetical protein HDQ90_05405 [Desulfovibrio sp.]|nr:hypothetical protein [Desulfovibrio sp.]